MTRDPLAADREARLGYTTARQGVASDPARSAWVSANAGSGKTHVLTQRVIRLLLEGARPSSILCLTYTKAAASEMSNRIFKRLADWATIADEALVAEIAAIDGRMPDLFRLADARRLFAKALETPGGLKIQTIHAFCEALLHQFPLEANVAGHFAVLDDLSASTLLADARRSLLAAAHAEGDPALAEAFAEVLDLADDTGLETLLGEIVASRQALRDFFRAAERAGGFDRALRDGLGIGPEETLAGRIDAIWPLPGLAGPMLSRFIERAGAGGSRMQAMAEGLEKAGMSAGEERFALLRGLFLTRDTAPKADDTVIAKPMASADPMLAEAVFAARAHVVACEEQVRRFRLYRATRAALILADRLDSDYEELKRQRCLLDFEDLITRTAELLTRDQAGSWVHYKLDQGIDHILIDEAQDTSPLQWTIIQSLAAEFFAGETARRRDRTIFAVGDEKQSIYSFQGARPERFSEERSRTERRVRESDMLFDPVQLPLSFRSTEDVLSAVDQVFALPEAARGLSASGDPVIHQSSRIGHAGAVDLWQTIEPEPTVSSDDWTAPFDRTPESAPAARLAERIAEAAAQMIGRTEIVEKGRRRPVEAGDILILVRKRGPFVGALTRALKRAGDLPVAGADRLRLSSHIAVQDLLALARFLLMPEDDLSLAAVLKSPLFDLGEERLLDLSARRPAEESLFAALLRESAADPLVAAHRDRLEALRTEAARLPVHEFYARLLGAGDGRQRFVARLGSEAADILDEFLTYTLEQEKAALPGLQAFVAGLDLLSPEVKREQDQSRNEIRIMTVHSAKGLEAPVVFLVDNGARAIAPSHMPKLRCMDTGRPMRVPAWIADKSLANSLTLADTARLTALAEEEYRRLLYVGMTRAADRLILCGYRGKRPVEDTWLDLATRALAADPERCRAVEFSTARLSWPGHEWRYPHMTLADLPAAPPAAREREDSLALPAALTAALPPPPILPRPLSPSGAGAFVDEEEGSSAIASPLFGAATEAARLGLRRGRLTHRLLQLLPGLAPELRGEALTRYLARAAADWPDEDRARLEDQLRALLALPALSALFHPSARAEVSVMGTIRVRGRDFAINGRIDRLRVTEDHVYIADFKTNRSPPASAAAVPFAHRAQLALYAALLRPLYPGRRISGLLVYTEAARVMVLDERDLGAALEEITAK